MSCEIHKIVTFHFEKAFQISVNLLIQLFTIGSCYFAINHLNTKFAFIDLLAHAEGSTEDLESFKTNSFVPIEL